MLNKFKGYLGRFRQPDPINAAAAHRYEQHSNAMLSEVQSIIQNHLANKETPDTSDSNTQDQVPTYRSFIRQRRNNLVRQMEADIVSLNSQEEVIRNKALSNLQSGDQTSQRPANKQFFYTEVDEDETLLESVIEGNLADSSGVEASQEQESA